MAESTHGQIVREQHTIRLLANPGTDQQRCLWAVLADRPGQVSHAISKGREKYPSAPLAWLLPDGTVVPVIP